jgi:hypothetical protein
LEIVNLCALERWVLKSIWLRRFVLQRHQQAFRRLQLPHASSIGIVGGGLFPRTALILRRLMPESTLILIDQDADNLEIARTFLSQNEELEINLATQPPTLFDNPRFASIPIQEQLSDVQFFNERFVSSARCDFDLLVIPLAFDGNRQNIYEHPPAKAVLVHDWIWRPRGASVIVSYLLLKRLNLVTR